MKKLLITESIKSFIEKGQNLLARKDIKIFIASSGEELINIHREENVDLIMTDIDFKEGAEEKICPVLKDIRDDDRLKKVSILTICDNDEAAIEKSYSCGANTFITKPVDVIYLIGKIVKLISVAERVHLRVIVNITVEGKINGKSFFANSENISITGILFETEEALEKGDNVTCTFFLGKDLITAAGEIVRVEGRALNQNFYGIQFLELDAGIQLKIEKFIKETIGNNL